MFDICSVERFFFSISSNRDSPFKTILLSEDVLERS